MRLAFALAALLAVLAVAVARPRRLPEIAVAAPLAALLIAVGAVSWSDARAEVSRLGPVVGFLAALLALAQACRVEGMFDAAGAALARRARRSGRTMLGGVVVAAAVTTAVLSLDTTVVLVTPVVLETARRAGLDPRPHLYATAHLANSASLLLPVANLTNLLALAVVPVTFARFAALMLLPWLVVVALTYAVFARRFAPALDARGDAVSVPTPRWPVLATVVVVATLAGFVACSAAGVSPAFAAVAGAAVLVGRQIVARRTTVVSAAASTAPAFCLFVLALGVIVRAVSDQGLGAVVHDVLPTGAGLPALLAIAGLSAVVANLVNNLPATLLLLPVAATGGTAPVLAVLIGVNVGPNLTYTGSLATLLWRRVVHPSTGLPRFAEFTVLGLLTVPVLLVAATVALWVSLRVVGAS